MYQPELGRFLQPDPKEFGAGDYNLYRYCHNDPVNKTDPLGLAPGDPFDSIEGAVRDVHSFINSTSIGENREYGSVIYRVGNTFYASPTFTNNAGSHVTVGAPSDNSRVTEGGHRVGDYHTHGDYSKAVLDRQHSRPGHPVYQAQRTTKSQDGYNSDHFSDKSDKPRAEAAARQNPEYRTFLGTPSRELKEYDAINKKEKNL
jgi:uncharacterized protein RhaS with RHS repeats